MQGKVQMLVWNGRHKLVLEFANVHFVDISVIGQGIDEESIPKLR